MSDYIPGEVVTETPAPGPRYTTEEVVKGEVLENYHKRTPSDDGRYVVVVTHTERIELVPQPPTPEEIAAQREYQKEQDKIALRIAGGVGVCVLGFFGLIAYLDAKDTARRKAVQQDPDTSL